MPKIRVAISLGGNTVVEGVDCTGEICKIKSRPIEEALGIVEDFREKDEYFAEIAQTAENKQGE